MLDRGPGAARKVVIYVRTEGRGRRKEADARHVMEYDYQPVVGGKRKKVVAQQRTWEVSLGFGKAADQHVAWDPA